MCLFTEEFLTPQIGPFDFLTLIVETWISPSV